MIVWQQNVNKQQQPRKINDIKVSISINRQVGVLHMQDRKRNM
jgi:hypothetical protein